jgi:DtxR family Mn-dependent transcriptional regulator
MSESEEMYLVSIARLSESGGNKPVALSDLAALMAVQPVSTHQMVRKLEEAGMVTYTPYKGVELTGEGKRLACRILRSRRLWEVFLVEKLRLSALESETIACRLEHVLPGEAVERLADFLGHPQVSPQGKPIPLCGMAYFPALELPLAQLRVGEQAMITRLQVDGATRSFLSSQGIVPETSLLVQALGGNREVLVVTETGETVHLSEKIAGDIYVKNIADPKEPK